jgi:hypothetical protein
VSTFPCALHRLLTLADYDAAAHISEEVHRAAIAAPVAIFVAVLNTGVGRPVRSEASLTRSGYRVASQHRPLCLRRGRR